jgi:hypothetical protein
MKQKKKKEKKVAYTSQNIGPTTFRSEVWNANPEMGRSKPQGIKGRYHSCIE